MSEKQTPADENMARFLALVPAANWRSPPQVWNETLRRALSDDLVTVGWGGVLKLTEGGKLLTGIRS